MFLKGRKHPETREIILMLCELQDFGLISLTPNRKNSDLIYEDYGIKVH